MTKQPPHPEVGRELFGPELKQIFESRIPTVVVCKKDKHPAYVTMGLYNVNEFYVHFRMEPTPGQVTIIGCRLYTDGKVYDCNTHEQIHVYEWLDPDAKIH